MENQIVCFLQHRFTMITFANHGYALDCNQKWWPMWNHQGPAPTTYLLPVPKNIVIRPRGQRCNKHRLVIPPCSSLHLQPPSTVTTWVQLTPNRQKLDRDVEAPAKMNIPFNGHLMRMILIIHWNWGGPTFRQTHIMNYLCPRTSKFQVPRIWHYYWRSSKNERRRATDSTNKVDHWSYPAKQQSLV